MNNKRLHILHLEDEPDFAELVRALLEQDNLDAEVKRVGDRGEFETALAAGKFDVILSDYHLPMFNGLQALDIVRKLLPDLPFILISGTIGEQAAIEGLRAGATDYLLKQNPERLPSAIRRAVQEAEDRVRRLEAEAELVRREKYFRVLTENLLDVLLIMDRAGRLIYASPSLERVVGHNPRAMVGQDYFSHIHPDDLPQARETFQSLLNHPGQTLRQECRYRHQDGSWRHMEFIGQNRLEDPEIGGVVSTCRDVTDRWRAEEELRRSEKQYRLLFQDNPNPMWVFDLETLQFLEVNEATIQHYGYSRGEFLAMKMTDIRPPPKDGVQKNAGLGDGKEGRIWRHRCKNGSFIEVEVVWSPMEFHGRFAALTLATDVTERRNNEHRNAVFSKLGQRLSSATTVAESAIIICEATDALFKWDDFALDLYFAERDEVFCLLNITTVDGQRVEIPASSQSRSTNTLVQRVVRNGAERLSSPGTGGQATSTMLAPIRKGERILGVLFVQCSRRDVFTRHDLETLQALADQSGGALERVRAEDALRESQQRFRDLFENSPDAIIVEDLDGTVLDVNIAASWLHGFQREQLIGKNAWNDLLPSHRQDEARRNFKALADQKSTRIETEFLRADGRSTPVEVRAGRIQYGGKPALLLHVRDITERREAETALHSSETLFRSVWESSVDGMRLTDENGVIVAVNETFCKLVGMDAKALEGQPFTVVYAGSENPGQMLANYREHFMTRTTGRKLLGRQYALLNGNVVTLEITDSFIQLRDRPLLVLSLFRDVTLQRRLEEQLRQSQKMEAIGQLAGGVAHDFNNILTVIHGHGSLLMAAGTLDEAASRSAEQIVQSAERAAGLTRQLLTFSRRQLIQPRQLDLNKVVGNMTNMLGRLLGEDVALQLNYCQSPPTVEADASMLEQVLLNLAVNARDAMPKGGQLSIRTTIVDVDEPHCQRHPEARPGCFACLSMTDTGSGISPENLQRVFEPFFTTKEVGKGTGLGLATVYGIAKQHKGWIEVDSQEGKGTTFRLYIPHADPPQNASEKPTTQIIVRGGHETILLVEDEAPVRELVARILEKYGYRILQAGTGLEAIDVWHKNRNDVALLLTDLIMPDHMNGRELAEKLWLEQPELKVIFTSGYSADIVGKDFKLEPELNFLQKPYNPQALALTVRRCLDGKRH